MEKPRVRIMIEDGVVMSVMTDTPVDIEILNIDSEAEDANALYAIHKKNRTDESLKVSAYSNGDCVIEP